MQTLVVGAGPAGLTAAYEIARRGRDSLVVERDAVVGGIARTLSLNGYRFDIGGHRFFTKVPEVQAIWEELLGDDFLERPRLSRIYYNGHFFDYPLRPLNALRGLGPVEAVRVMLSYLRACARRSGEDQNLEEWVSRRFGRRLYEIFFKTYTEKVWGMPCTEIDASWAAQRIKNLDLGKAVLRALLPARGESGEVITSLVERFHYPRRGPGMMWERAVEWLAARGTKTLLETDVVRLEHRGGRVHHATIRRTDGSEERMPVEHVISSMPLGELIRALDPAPPAPVLEAAAKLRYRDFLTVGLVVDQKDLFPDNWIYIHSADVNVGRIQNFKNWSPEMVADPDKTFLGLEYFVQEGDELWSTPDADLVVMAARECETLGLVAPRDVEDGAVVRMPKAYPVYDATFKAVVRSLRDYLATIENLESVGRNGQHRYNNQDHSMMTGVYAARNLLGANYDVWDVNVEEAYHEENREKDAACRSSGGPELVA